MSTEPFALSTIAHDSREDEKRDYEAIRATVMESARGRWFLEEYARRNRNADIQLVLAAMERIESLIRDEPHQRGYRIGNSDISQPPATIAATPAAVAQPQSGAGAEPPDRDGLPADSEISALAERLQDIAWTMRERGLDAAICDQIESLASCIRGPSPSQSTQGHQELELNEAGINPFGAPSSSGEPAVAKEPEQQALACSADEETQLPEKESAIPTGAVLPWEAGALSGLDADVPSSAADGFAELELDPLIVEPPRQAAPTPALPEDAELPLATDEVKAQADAAEEGLEVEMSSAESATTVLTHNKHAEIAAAEVQGPLDENEIESSNESHSPDEQTTDDAAAIRSDIVEGRGELTEAAGMDNVDADPGPGPATHVEVSEAGPPVSFPSAASATAELVPLAFEESVFADEPATATASEPDSDPVPAMPPLLSDIPQEDILSGAWEEAASKPQMETPLPTQQESSSPADTPEILDHSKIDIWGQSPDIVPAKSGQSDPMLALEQELFAASAINPENEMRPAQAAPVVESQSAIATDNAPAKQPIVPKAMEQMPVAPVPAPNDSAAAHPAPILPTARPMPRATPDDPLAALRAMTDEQRIALFT